MKYFKETGKDGNIIALFMYEYHIEIDEPGITEITEEEYTALLKEMENREEDETEN